MILKPATFKDVRGYTDSVTGRFYPASGSILDLLFPSKMEWIDEKYLEEGARCHELMKVACVMRRTNGIWPDSDHPRVQALIDELKLYHFEPVEAEDTRASAFYGYAGTPDGLMKRGRTYVVPDWKFAESVEERYLYQLQSYQMLFPDLEEKPALMIWRVTREAKVKPIAVKPNAVHWAEFLAANTVMKKRLR